MNLLLKSVKKKSHPFSLIEVMVALLLVSIVAGVSAFSILPLYRSYRFRLAVESVYELARELQLEAMTLQSDMKMRLTKEGGHWKAISITTETVLKPQTIDLSHVDQVEKRAPLTITFYSSGQVFPKEIVTFVYHGEKRGLDFTRPPLIKLWIGSPQRVNDPVIPDLDQIKSFMEKKNEASKPSF